MTAIIGLQQNAWLCVTSGKCSGLAALCSYCQHSVVRLVTYALQSYGIMELFCLWIADDV